MSKKSWQLSRRTFLQGSGVAMALPLLDSMADADDAQELPRRFCSVYFPFGVSLPPEKHEHAEWNWFPEGGGKDLFVHINEVEGGQLQEGDNVEFDETEGPKGKQASNVKVFGKIFVCPGPS